MQVESEISDCGIIHLHISLGFVNKLVSNGRLGDKTRRLIKT